MNNHIQMNKENLHEILRQTWNREISADDALELLEDTLSEVMEANRLLKNVKQSAVDLTAAGMDVLERAKTAEAEVERLRKIPQSVIYTAGNYDVKEQLYACHAQSHGMSRRIVEAEMKLEVSEAEVERLTAMVMESARLGDSRASNFKDRAEKAESLLTQIQAFTEALNPKIK